MKAGAPDLCEALLSLSAHPGRLVDRTLEEQVRFAAYLFDQNPDAVWADFERNGPLARLLRAAIGSPRTKRSRGKNVDRKQAIAECYFRHTEAGLAPKQAREATARELTAHGQNVSEEAIEVEIRRNGMGYFFG